MLFVHVTVHSKLSGLVKLLLIIDFIEDNMAKE